MVGVLCGRRDVHELVHGFILCLGMAAIVAPACRGERREVLIDGDLETPFRPDLVEVLADHVDGVRVDPRARGARQAKAASPASAARRVMPHCSATVSSQDRIAQIASWLSTPSKGGM